MSSGHNYDDFYEGGGWKRDRQYPFRVFKNLSRIRALPNEPFMTKSALDLGCGRGEFSEALAEIGFGEVLGMDLSSKAIEISERNPTRSTRTHYVQADFFQYNFEDKKFNFILALGFSPFNSSDFRPVEGILQRLRDLLNPSGSIAICIPSNGRSGGTSWYCWDANQVETVQQLANRYFDCVETYHFTRIARPRWPVFRFNSLINYFLGLLCRATGKSVVFDMLLRSPKEPNEHGS